MKKGMIIVIIMAVIVLGIGTVLFAQSTLSGGLTDQTQVQDTEDRFVFTLPTSALCH
jgi:hypothetical protein